MNSIVVFSDTENCFIHSFVDVFVCDPSYQNSCVKNNISS
jgi:hypothetical protein